MALCLMEIILTVFLVYGITFSLTQAKLFSRLRVWITSKSSFIAEMLSCPFCTGFHSGWLSFLLLSWCGIASFPLFPGILVYGFAGASISYILELIVLRLEPSESELSGTDHNSTVE